jgi:hypothetical protein
MAANDPRMEFRPTPELRRKLELYRQELSRRGEQDFSMSEVLGAILEEFLADLFEPS